MTLLKSDNFKGKPLWFCVLDRFERQANGEFSLARDVRVKRTELVELDNNFIKAHNFGSPGAYALLSVSDTGMGMDEKTR